MFSHLQVAASKVERLPATSRVFSVPFPITKLHLNIKKNPNCRLLGTTMNSEVGKWFADFIVLLFIVGLLKSLLTSVEVGN